MSAYGVMPASLRAFLARHGFGAGATLKSLGGGGRHRVLSVAAGGRKAVLKIHEEPSSGRDAFHREMVVHDLFAAHVPHSVPRIVGRDSDLRCVLFEWVEGRKLSAGEVDAEAARGMAWFAAAINAVDSREAAQRLGLPKASDAAFSLAAHRKVARDRLETLRAARSESLVGRDLEAFVADTLLPALEALGLSDQADAEQRENERVISPSDFGFHNVIVRPDGSFCFIDFEHAGWDDPAKLAADFILQPECKLGGAVADAFLLELESSGRFPGNLRERVTALLPIQAIKWCAIILNVFNRPGQPQDLLLGRLEKARRYWCHSGHARSDLQKTTD